jgi:hypothetical protein
MKKGEEQVERRVDGVRFENFEDGRCGWCRRG